MPSGGDRRDAQWQIGSARLSHTPHLRGLEVTERTGCSLGDQASHRYQSPTPPCQGDLALSQQKWKVSHGHLFTTVALCFFCFHKNSTGSASPSRHPPNCSEQHKQPPAPSPGLTWLPRMGSFCPMMLICLGFYSLLQDSTACTDQDSSTLRG